MHHEAVVGRAGGETHEGEEKPQQRTTFLISVDNLENGRTRKTTPFDKGRVFVFDA